MIPGWIKVSAVAIFAAASVVQCGLYQLACTHEDQLSAARTVDKVLRTADTACDRYLDLRHRDAGVIQVPLEQQPPPRDGDPTEYPR